nr:MAG TPA: hypothetical protein [Caudoviricetes sp.]
MCLSLAILILLSSILAIILQLPQNKSTNG